MSANPSSVEIADMVSDLMYGIAGWLLIGLGSAAFLSGTGGVIQHAGTSEMIVPLLLLGLAFVFITSGIFVNPRFRRRLDRRHNLSRFGQAKTVDSRVLSPSENRYESCVSCGSSLSKGIVRRYRQEYVAAGIPVWAISANRNFYCPNCATEELSGPISTDTGNSDVPERTIAETE
jgi:predicted RNA-binding Zn-ribbon protein involved in translation (DUF1610 family)